MTALWAGTEDLEYVPIGGAVFSTNSAYFRAGMGTRCALFANGDNALWESFKSYALTAFWLSGRVISSGSSNNNGANNHLLEFLDEDLIERIRVCGEGGYSWRVYKVDALGAVTKIGNSFFFPFSATAGKPDKIDVYMNYDVAGSIDIYINFIHVFAFIGDCTTDGVTQLCRHRLGGGPVSGSAAWSETWIDDEDTRSQGLASFNPVANGNANTFDTGTPSASNINEITLDPATLNGSSSAGQIDQYTNGAVPANTLDVKDLIISAYAQRGTAGPTKLALGVRTNGADYWGSDQPLDVAWQNIQEVFSVNPDTTNEWLRTEIGAAVGFNIGAKSAA